MSGMPKQLAEKAVKVAAQAVVQEIQGREDNGWRQGKPIEDPEKTKRWGFVTAKPSEYLVHMRSGKVRPKTSGQGATCFKWPWDSVAVIPTTLQRLYFVADQVTREKVGVQVKGLAVYRIARPELAVRMLNFSYPERAQEKLADTIKEMFVGAARRLIANISVEDCLTKRKEALGAFLVSEIAPIVGGAGKMQDSTDRGWGVVIDTIEVQDVRVLSERVFADMQAPFRNQLAVEARLAELERERATEIREAEAARAIEEARAKAAAEMRELKARAESEAAAAEQAEELKRLVLDAQTEKAKLAGAREAQKGKLDAEIEAKRQRAEAEDRLAREAQERQAEQQLSAIAHQREGERVRIEAEAEAKRAKAEAEDRASREAIQRKAEQAIEEMKQAQSAAEAEAALREAKAEGERRAAAIEFAAAIERAQAERKFEAEKSAIRADAKEAELRWTRVEGDLKNDLARALREVENTLSPERLQLELISRGLPEIAKAFNQRFGEIKVFTGASDNPFAFLVHAFESVLEVAKKSGVAPSNGAQKPQLPK
jgi:flotillin